MPIRIVGKGTARGAFIVLSVLAGCHGGPPPAGVQPEATSSADLERLRTATDRYHDLSTAVADGYVADVPSCIVHEHHGAMGYHHLNRSYLTRELSVERPQFLLYEKMPDGDYRLNGVEYILPYRLWPRDTVPPTIMGQRMKPENTFEYWYLHVWAWKENPDGLFADFHPGVNCPDEARKVYRPNP